MPKPPKNWPPGAVPARMDAKCAAFFVGDGLTAFLQGVETGTYPKPTIRRGRKLWRTSALLAAIDSRDNPPQPTGPETDDEWLGEMDRADAHHRH